MAPSCCRHAFEKPQQVTIQVQMLCAQVLEHKDTHQKQLLQWDPMQAQTSHPRSATAQRLALDSWAAPRAGQAAGAPVPRSFSANPQQCSPPGCPPVHKQLPTSAS